MRICHTPTWTPRISNSLSCTSQQGCISVSRSLQLYWHDVFLAVHFYGCFDAPSTCVCSWIFLFDLSLSVGIGFTVLARAHPIHFFVCVWYHDCPLFYTNLYVAGQKVHCLVCMTGMLVWHGPDEVMHPQWGWTQCQGHQQGFYDLVTQLGIPRPAYVSYAVLLPWGSHTATQNCSAVPVCGTLGSFDTRVHQCVCRSCLTSVWCHPRKCRCSVSDQPMLGCWLIQVLLLQVFSLCAYLLRIRCATIKFLLCKFFESEVQVTDWLLTRPVWGHESHDDPGHGKE